MANEPKFFKVEKDGAVIIWRFYNPPRNLWDEKTGPEFIQLVESFYQDPDLRVGIFTSAMPDIFIQHYDVSLLVKRGEELLKAKTPPVPVPRRPGFRRDSKPIIAAINAPLAGGGLELAISFDFRFMSRAASASQGEINVGILPPAGSQYMPRLVGVGRALELMLTGRRIFADEAERIGLITRACDPLRLMPEATEFAKELASKSPFAVSLLRRCVYEGIDMPLSDGLALAGELFQETIKSLEALERMRAYVATGQDPQHILREQAERERQT
jgi:enoyl-CoA hydratase/carnithine racemase